MNTTKVSVIVETKVAEQELEEDDYPMYLAEDDVNEEQIFLMSAKLHNLLLNLTTGDANAVVRRCRGRHGLLVSKIRAEKSK